jgi:hypothetical protein
VTDAAIPPGGTEVLDPPWDPWRPADIARLLAGVTVPWYVAGGWAIDLFIGRQTREHGDLEIAIPASAFAPIRGVLADYEFDVVGSGQRWPLDSPAFAATASLLGENAAGWLRWALQRVHPGHAWIGALDRARAGQPS